MKYDLCYIRSARDSQSVTGALPGAAAVLKHFPSPTARARSFFKNKWFIFEHQQGQLSSMEGTESSAETTVSAATQKLPQWELLSIRNLRS